MIADEHTPALRATPLARGLSAASPLGLDSPLERGGRRPGCVRSPTPWAAFAFFTLALAFTFALGGCGSPAPKDYTPTWARFYLESTDERAGVVVLPRSGVRIATGEKPVLAENDVLNVEIAQVELGRCLMFQVTPAAARDLYRLTGSNQGRRLVLTLNGEPLGARPIDGPFADGNVLVFVEIDDAALPELVRNLKRSALALQAELGRK